MPHSEIHVGLDSGLHETGIRGIQDTRQIVDGQTTDKENNDKKGGSPFLDFITNILSLT